MPLIDLSQIRGLNVPDLSKTFKLLDAKIIGGDDTELWHNVGTGSFTFDANTILMAVGANQYCVRQTKVIPPYSSGSVQYVEFTMDFFNTEANVKKMVGAYTSSTVAPYTANYDGYWIENNNGTISMKSANNGTITTTKDFANWTNYAQIQNYDWSKFRAGLIEYLWLGGARYRLWLISNEGDLILANDNSDQFNGVGTKTITLSPHKPIRYELRSSGGTGSFRATCSQISSGSDNGNLIGRVRAYTNGVKADSINTTYAIMGIKKQSGYLENVTKILDISGVVASTDSGILSLYLNPTLSAPLVYTSNGNKIQIGNATNQTITSVSPENVIMSKALGVNVASSLSNILENDQSSYLPSNVDGTFPELVLGYTPISNNQIVRGIIQVRHYN